MIDLCYMDTHLSTQKTAVQPQHTYNTETFQRAMNELTDLGDAVHFNITIVGVFRYQVWAELWRTMTPLRW